MKSILYLMLIIFNHLLEHVESEICRALVLGGGGSKGSYQAGAIQGIVNATKDLFELSKRARSQGESEISLEDTQWDVVSGISVGSLNSAYFYVYKKGEEQGVINELIDLWSTIEDKDVFSFWGETLIDGLDKPAFLNTEPLRQTLLKRMKPYISSPFYRKINIGAVTLNNEIFTRFTEKDFIKSPLDLVNATLCSSAIPTWFPPRICDGTLYIDGGTLYIFDIFGAVDRCKEITQDESEIIIDIVLCDPDTYTQETTQTIMDWKTPHYFTIANKYPNRYASQIQEVQETHPQVNFRYLVYPAQDLPEELIPLNFNPDLDKKYIQKGYLDGYNTVLNFQKKKKTQG